MVLTDTHTHLYLEEFDNDRDYVIERALAKGIKKMFLPNIDSGSVNPMLDLCKSFPGVCYPMIGLHPTSVKENYKEELEEVGRWLDSESFIAIGEIGIDLYWDKTFKKEQEFSFRHQIRLALEYDLPIVIHSRESHDEIVTIVREYTTDGLEGVFHCFTGTYEQALEIISLGFMLGIGGVLTFKKSGLDSVIEKIGLQHFILETDSPFLAPVPYRGRRNETAYLSYIAEKIAVIKDTTVEEVAVITTSNAMELFKLSA